MTSSHKRGGGGVAKKWRMMTRGGEGVSIPPKNDDVIYEQPLTFWGPSRARPRAVSFFSQAWSTSGWGISHWNTMTNCEHNRSRQWQKLNWIKLDEPHYLRIFYKNTSVFLQQHLSISATSFCIFATRSIYTEAQRHSFDPKNVTWQTCGPNRPLEWESDDFPWPTRGHNWPSWHRMRKWWFFVTYLHGVTTDLLDV